MGKFFWFLTGGGLGLSVSQNFKYKTCWVANRIDLDVVDIEKPINFGYPTGFKDDKDLELIKKEYRSRKD